MINRSLAFAAALGLAALVLGSTSSSAQQFRSTCPLGAEQFGGHCNHGYYTPPRFYQVQPRAYYYTPPQQRQGDQAERLAIRMFGLAIGMMLNH